METMRFRSTFMAGLSCLQIRQPLAKVFKLDAPRALVLGRLLVLAFVTWGGVGCSDRAAVSEVSSSTLRLLNTYSRRADFNADTLDDIALTGNSGSIPVAFSNGDGTFTNLAFGSGNCTTATYRAVSVAGDFDGDGLADIASLGAPGSTAISLAYSLGDGRFYCASAELSDFAGWAAQPGVKPLAGDFDRDGRADIALVGGLGWGSVPVALSNGDGTFRVVNTWLPDFPTWATAPGAKPVVGDFDNDGEDDIALVGGAGWGSMPVAFSNGDGTFRVVNTWLADFPGWATQLNAMPVAGDFDGDFATDIALTGMDGWTTIPIAHSNFDGSFYVTNSPVQDFPTWATQHAQLVSGYFNDDVCADLALVGGGPNWSTLPVAFSNCDGTFTVTNNDNQGYFMEVSVVPDVVAVSASQARPPGGYWQPLTTPPSFAAETALLLTDGSVAVHVSSSPDWWRLVPDAAGSYVNGAWSQMASMDADYGPTFFASAVLPDGRLVVAGGEYNLGQLVWLTDRATIYNPVTNAWTDFPLPSYWSKTFGGLGDAQSVVLPNGKFMVADPSTRESGILDPLTLTWTITGASTKADQNDEEGWTLLPSGKVLAVDVFNGTNSEVYDPNTGAWSSAGSTVTQIAVGGEIGPAILMPNGVVLATGANSHTALFDSIAGTWSAGPDIPNSLNLDDGPAALLPNGHVIIAPSNGSNDKHFFEFDGRAFTEVAKTPDSPGTRSTEARLIMLPSGQLLQTDSSGDVQIYTPRGRPDPAWAPTITNWSTTVQRGNTGAIVGTQFNGLSQASGYGDDAQQATNYPMVRITNYATGHVTYARTHDHSTMAVATGSTGVFTEFDVPIGTETGSSAVQVVANGIASDARPITIQ